VSFAVGFAQNDLTHLSSVMKWGNSSQHPSNVATWPPTSRPLAICAMIWRTMNKFLSLRQKYQTLAPSKSKLTSVSIFRCILDRVVLGRRRLWHPHVDEQPFTRSLFGIAVPEGVREVIIRAHSSVHGYGGTEIKVKLPEK